MYICFLKFLRISLLKLNTIQFSITKLFYKRVFRYSRKDFTLVLKLIYCFLAVPAACASSQGRDWTCTTAAACPSCCRDKAGSLTCRAAGELLGAHFTNKEENRGSDVTWLGNDNSPEGRSPEFLSQSLCLLRLVHRGRGALRERHYLINTVASFFFFPFFYYSNEFITSVVV